jgi:3-deoxy-D-manno-octulosonate 8-phosphate phosphatase (KDO 8-P phosphatase)
MGLKKEIVEKARPVRLLLLDVDGVMTDGSIIYNDVGQESKNFNVRDGHGLKLLTRSGVDCALITARKSEALVHRARDLAIELVYQGAIDKLKAYEDILKKMDLTPEETAYVGDDVVDLPLLTRVGFSVAVCDAVEEVKERVDYVTETAGGRGAVREVVEIILKAKGIWDELMNRYLR